MTAVFGQPSTWITVPVEPPPVEPPPVEPPPVDENEGLVSCLRCQTVYNHELSHYCPTVLIKSSDIEMERFYRKGGWVVCLRCRSFYRGEHNCAPLLGSPSRPVRPAKPVITGSFDDIDSVARVVAPYYGIRLGFGLWAKSGSVDHEVRDRQRSRDWSQRLSENTRAYESPKEAAYWEEWRYRTNFLATAPKLALATFRQGVWQYGFQNYEPGHYYPESHRRYHVIGVVEKRGKEFVVNLGFWMGPPGHVLRLEFACNDAARAIIRRWHAQAGFSWGEVKI